MADRSRRDFLKKMGSVAASAGALSAFSDSAEAADQQRPNILFIMTDDHDRQALSCYDSVLNKTPNLDRLAKEGMRFEHCCVTNSICEPSRAVILTGKCSHHNGVLDNRTQFDAGQQTFPKLLRKAGYQTAMIGKWHLKSSPTGFDYWNVLPGQGRYYNPTFIEMGERKKYQGYVTDITTDRALEWLEGRESDKPFCLMWHHKAPHRKWLPGPEQLGMYNDTTFPEPPTLFDDYSTRCAAAREQEMTIKDHMGRRDLKLDDPGGLTDKQMKRWQAAFAKRKEEWKNRDFNDRELVRWKYQCYMRDYLSCIESVDQNVGRMLDYLDRSGLAENTVVVYTSDQGFFLGNHGWFDKRFMYEQPLHMPCLVRYPKEIPPGSVNDNIALNLDFAPTFLDFAGIDAPADMQGRSLRPILQGSTPDDWRSSMYYHYYEYPAVHMVKRHYGIRTERYKLIHFYFDIDAWELYDLKKDPHEVNNVYDDPAYAKVQKRLKEELRALQKQYGESDEMAMDFVREYLKQYPNAKKRLKHDVDLKI